MKYGKCSKCGRFLYPIWFIERETKVSNGHMTETGRKRTACSHLECDCGNKECVDDTFDGKWD